MSELLAALLVALLVFGGGSWCIYRMFEPWRKDQERRWREIEERRRAEKR